MKTMARGFVLVLFLASLAILDAQTRPSPPLRIYVVDTEGGKAALFVAPSGETVLIDTGSPGGRDTDRLMAAVKDAGVERIDHLISTHYHVDHIGGMQELAKRLPIAHYIDHGPSVEAREQIPGFQQAYAELRRAARHTVVVPGDRVPVAGLDWHIVTAGGKAMEKPLPGGGRPNPACASAPTKPANPSDENSQSVGSVITYGRFRAIDLGDLLWHNEHELMCPDDPIGDVDLYMVTHHGLDSSGSPAVVHGVRPRVAVMQNGTRKGAGPGAMTTMRGSPGLEDIWQLHWSHGAGIEGNSAGVFIANVDDPETIAGVLTASGRPAGAAGATQAAGGTPTARPQPAAPHVPAYWIKISAEEDGTFTVSNSRNGFSKTYAPRGTRR